jgi:subtilisin family serine protease
MNKLFYLLLLGCFVLITPNFFCQFSPFFSIQLEKNPNELYPTCVKNNIQNEEILKEAGIEIKYKTKNWIFFNTTAENANQLRLTTNSSNLFYELAPPHSLADTALVRHKINLVHQGVGLDTSYTGKGVIIGIVDQGLDFNHPDFKHANGQTRVLRYWDHTVNSSTPPPLYGYGTVWNNTAINNGTCTSLETGTAHGTTVSGIATGNARANQKHKGAAPESDIIVVETNFNFQNWTLSIADACDYIFKVADSLGKPAVINLSLGSYLGSHDGRDPAGEYIDSLLEAKEGRIVVCAAGNSGNNGKYHVRNDVTSDTSFFWNINNPGNTFVGNNKILFDLWGDTSTTNYQFAYGADRPGASYGFVGRTNFRTAMSDTNGVVVFDTIYNNQGQRVACIETWREIVGPNFHMQTIFRTIDSLDYLYRFETVGSGTYDAWGGAWQRCSDFVTAIPSATILPEISNYVMPDSLQTIVSSWNCSPKVISVGNLQNRKSYIDKNNNVQTFSGTPGTLASSSSKGPTRLGVMKPDVSASGDISFGSGPLLYLANSANNATIDVNGFHVRNGGTSMASPVVAGSAALYLQKCNLLNYEDFKTDLILSSTTDSQTGITPNFGYGYGKLNTQNLVLLKHEPVSISGPDGICLGDNVGLSFQSSMNPSSILWSTGSQTTNISISISGSFSVLLTDENGCRSRSPVKVLSSYQLPFVDAGPNHIVCPNTPLTLLGSGTASLYEWTNNVPNNQPFIPSVSGFYLVTGTDGNGCTNEDSTFVDFFTLMPVSYSETSNEVDLSDLAFNVTAGNPVGGSYSGTGIIGTSFHPGLAGVGTHPIVYSVLNSNGCYSTDTSFITVLNNAGITEQHELIQIFPNPTSSNIVIKVNSPYNYNLLSSDGKSISQGPIVKELNLDLSELSHGIYFIKLNNESEIYEFKISKIE